MKLDLHMHPLCHEYYDGWSLPHGAKIDSADKERIRQVVNWCIARKLDVISITDHDMIEPSLYAMEYVKENGLPIIVVPGIEMEIHDEERIHLCAWGIKEQPKYAHCTPVKEVVDMIHSMGGIVIMNHPTYSQSSFERYYNILDGYEYINRDDEPFEKGREFLKAAGHTLMEYRNSDYHYNPPFSKLSTNPKYFPQEINIWDEVLVKEWLGKLGG